MRPTVKDVATLAGVSPKTISNVMNGIVFVRPETRERVEWAIRELGYVPNLSARGLRNGKSGVIALAMADLSTPYSAEMSHHFVEVAREHGWGVQFEETSIAAGQDRASSLVSRARQHLVDGVILNPVTLAESEIVASAGLPPLVMIGEVRQNVADQVWVDSVVAARDMTEHLIGLGHRRIAAVGVVGVGFEAETARLRGKGYRQGLEAAGLATDERLELSCATWTPGAAAEVIARFLLQNELPDAFFCFTDSMAIGVLSALWSAGISVPGDVSVAGFDDIADGQFATPPLTTVSFDKRAFAEQAFALLKDRMTNRDAPLRQITIPHSIVSRSSAVRRS